MRSLHLCFWLHHAYELHEADKWAQKGYYGGEVAFREANGNSSRFWRCLSVIASGIEICMFPWW